MNTRYIRDAVELALSHVQKHPHPGCSCEERLSRALEMLNDALDSPKEAV